MINELKAKLEKLSMMEQISKHAEADYDPITSGWEDGCGNGCSLDGWGDALQEDEMENC